MKQRFLNQKLGKRTTRRVELQKAKNLLRKTGPNENLQKPGNRKSV
jgi:hypothetical protein